MHVDVQCYEGRSLDTVTQAESIASWGDVLARDYTTYTAAAAMLETADRLTEEREPNLQQYLLLAGALRSMAEGLHDPGLVLDAYLLRALAIAGWAPSFHDCARCGAPGPHRAFNLASGGTVCPSCRPPASAAPAPETLALLASLLAGDWVIADASSARHRREASGLAGAFLQWHLERGVRSLRLVDRRDPDRPEADSRVTWSTPPPADPATDGPAPSDPATDGPPPVEPAPVERVRQAHAALAGRAGEA
jgi:DNA repair protein RecO (recombination protein O)